MIIDDGVVDISNDMFRFPSNDNYYETIIRIRMSVDEAFRIKKYGTTMSTIPVFCSRAMFKVILNKVGESNIKRTKNVTKRNIKRRIVETNRGPCMLKFMKKIETVHIKSIFDLNPILGSTWSRQYIGGMCNLI
jgi:hypothetical protein